MKELRYWVLTCWFLGAGSAGVFGAAKTDPRLTELAGWLETGTLKLVYEQYSCSERTQELLARLSNPERRQLAKAVRKLRNGDVRVGRVDQYRGAWRSRELPESEVVVSFYLNVPAGDALKPVLAFSSHVDHIPALLAQSLKENNVSQVLSFYDPLSPWVERIPKLTPAQRMNLVTFYRSMKRIEKAREDRVYKGPYLSESGILVQEELRIRLGFDGRWLVS